MTVVHPEALGLIAPEGHPMPHHAHPFFMVLVGLLWAISNVVTWMRNQTIGSILTTGSMVTLGIVTVAVAVAEKIDRSKNAKIADKLRVEREAEYDRLRLARMAEADRRHLKRLDDLEQVKVDLEIKAATTAAEVKEAAAKVEAEFVRKDDQDKASQSAVAEQLITLQKSANESQASLDAANRKLHEQKNRENAIAIQLQGALLKLDGTTVELQATRKELQEAKEAAAALMAKIDRMTGQVKENTENLATLASQSNTDFPTVKHDPGRPNE